MVDVITGASLQPVVQGRDRWNTHNPDFAGRSLQMDLVHAVRMAVQDQLGPKVGQK